MHWASGTISLYHIMTLFIILIFVPILVIILLGLNLLLAPSEVDSEKISTYESGFEPIGTARSQFSISFYLVAILFLIFDLEIALFYPLATSLNLVSTYGFIVGLIFLSVLTFGFVFEYGSGVISFLPRRPKTSLTYFDQKVLTSICFAGRALSHYVF